MLPFVTENKVQQSHGEQKCISGVGFNVRSHMLKQDLDWSFLQVLTSGVVISDVNTQHREKQCNNNAKFKLFMETEQMSSEKDRLREIILPSIFSLIRYPHNTAAV